MKQLTFLKQLSRVLFAGSCIAVLFNPQPAFSKDFVILPNGQPATGILTEIDEIEGTILRGVIQNARWERELDWALTDYPLAGGPSQIGGLLYLRNEKSDAVVYLQGLAENGNPLIPPRPNPMVVPESGYMNFLADLFLAGGTNRTVKLIVTSDGDPTPPTGTSDTLTAQVLPPIPTSVIVTTVPVGGSNVTATLTERQENAGTALKCVIPNSQWVHELDWALTDYPLAGGASQIGGLLYLRNEGPNAAVYLLGLAEDGTPLIPPRPNPMVVPKSGYMNFLADLLTIDGKNWTAKMIVTSDGDPTPLDGTSDTLSIQVVPVIPATVVVTVVPATNGPPVSSQLTEQMEVDGTALKYVIPDAQWVRELDWALSDYPLSSGPQLYGGLLYLRNEGPNAAVYLLGQSENGPPLTPPRPNPMVVPESGYMNFLADLLTVDGKNWTVKMSTTSDGDPNTTGISDTLSIQVVPPIPLIVDVSLVPVDGKAVTANLTETQEVAGVALKCVIPDAQWLRELDWAIMDQSATGAPEIGDLLYLRNEGPNAAVYLIGGADNGPALLPPRPNPIQVEEADTLQFLGDLLLLGPLDRTAIITMRNDSVAPLPGGFSDTLTVQVVPRNLTCGGNLKVVKSGNNIVVTWDGGGILQTTPSLNPPSWTPVPGNPAGSYVTAATGSNQFFRVCCSYTGLSAGGPGVSLLDPKTLFSAVPIINDGTSPAENVEVKTIKLADGELISPAVPVNLGTIPVDGSAILNADFSGGPFLPGKSYGLTLQGTYSVGAINFDLGAVLDNARMCYLKAA